MGIVEQYLLQLNTLKRRFRRSVAFLTALSLLVVMTVFWNLRQTGITIANDACCGLEEHQHTEGCILEKVLICGFDEEIPTEEATEAPTEEATEVPTEEATEVPTEEATETPTEEATEAPTEEATEVPTEEATEAPTEEATETPAEETTEAPTEEPTEAPAEDPTEAPTEAPTEMPTEVPMEEPVKAVAEVPEETAMEAVLSAAADVLAKFVPVAYAAEVSEAESTDVLAEESEEHIHTDACYEITYQCGLEEHIHDFTCYPDLTADLEDWDIWAASIPELTGQISEDIVLVAQSQLGCMESTLNYELADDGVSRNGITRYGQWYGNPYGPWSNMFTSFCLRYAGVSDLPINSGAEKMQMEWEAIGLYYHAGGYEPLAGDIIFFDKNQNGVPEATGVVTHYFDFVLTVIEGDVDNAVVQTEYRIDDPVITGYGITNSGNRVMMLAAANRAKTIGQTATYSNNLLTNGGTFIVYTTGSDGKYYAIDGDGAAVEIQISNTGAITANVEDTNMLYWTFEKASNYDNKAAYYICNAATGMYLHPNADAGAAGSLHSGKWETALYPNGNGVRFRGARQDAYALLSGDTFTYATTQNTGSTFYFGKPPAQLALWLDGTNGNIMSYRGSDNTKYTVYSGVEMQLPSTWKSPTKYSYTLAGWVNIKTGEYYKPGDMITVTENTVLYADWVATTYDIGQYNSYVADTVSTNDFITTHVFDYSSLINLLSTKVTVNVSDSSHSETWAHVGSGNVSYKNQETLNFSFNDHDSSGTITNLNNLNDPNKYTGGTAVYSGIYNAQLGETLFGIHNLFDPEAGEGVVGKHYLGQGDHLFQINTDPTSDYYGYYYYDAKLNAASYNQSDQRFYVYEYLARTSDSANNNDAGKYSDFLPLNSPYANTNGQTIKTYNYAGENGEYNGISHYVYDARYDANGSAANQVIANLWFGMRTDVQFGLPDTSGQKLANGEYGNKDIHGNDMHFHFTGDDDVWILMDGKVALDLGGIHQAAEGDINFSTGEVRVNGKSVGTLSGIGPGEHTLSILYLERGSSMSNCAIYFNLAPRFSLTLEKEDVLTQEVLNGAQFAFYHDQACTQPCDLWPSQQSYKNGEEPTNIFTIQNGKAFVWGLSPSQTYYIREKAPPNAVGYDPAKGVIQLTLDKNGLNSYSATILEGPEGTISHGFTLHGFRIDEKNQAAYITITNAQNWVTETTSVYVEKKWNDTEDHTYDAVTVYLNVTDDDGTVRRIREITLSEENDWKYSWVNLPKYTLDPDTMAESDTPVKYSVSEAYVPGYTNQVTVLTNGTYTDVEWGSSGQLYNGKQYILSVDGKYISTVAADQTALCLVDEATAKESPLALWTATVSSGYVKLTNQAGQSLTYYASGATRYFTTATNSSANQNLTQTKNGGGIYLAYKSGNRSYYLTSFNTGKSYFDAKDAKNSAKTILLMERRETTTTVELEGLGYTITNSPLDSETSLKVTKHWDYPEGDASFYEKEQVTIRLLANGVDTGRTETVSLKTNWTATFSGLPYVDEEGNPINYTVVESWDTSDWIPVYGPVTSTGGSIPTYETTVINTYRWTGSFELPSTGGIGYPILILCGLPLVAAPLVYGLSLRRRHRKEARE